MPLAVVISAWNEEPLLEDCLASVAPLGAPVIVADGAYDLYLNRHLRHWSEDRSCEIALKSGATWVSSPSQPYPSEAAKKAALADEAQAKGATWALYLDADERLEYPFGEKSALDQLDDVMDGPAYLGVVALYWPTEPGRDQWLPRLVCLDGLTFEPPHDYWPHRYGQPLARGGQILTERERVAVVSELRIRHDRHLRSQERQMLSARYLRRRQEKYGERA